MGDVIFCLQLPSPRHIRRTQSFWSSLIIPQQFVYSVRMTLITLEFLPGLLPLFAIPVLICSMGVASTKRALKGEGCVAVHSPELSKPSEMYTFSYHRDANYTHLTSLKTPEQVRER